MSERPALRRVLGFSDVFNFLVGTVIGSGVFLVSAAMASATGSPVLMLGVWVLGGALSLFGALALAELGAAYPESGGMYVYLKEAYGPLVAFLFGWTSFLVIEGGGIATLSSAFATRYLPFFVEISPASQRIVAVTLILTLGVVNVLGVKGSAMVQRVLTALKIAAILAIVIGLLLFAEGDASHFTAPPLPPLSPSLLSGIGVALVASLWAYKGWELVSMIGGEVRDAQRNMPLGLLIGTAVVVALYLLANVAYLYVLPLDAIAASPRVAADAMQAGLGGDGARMVAGIVLVSIVGAMNGNIFTSSRLFFAMARDGLFFDRMAAVHARFETPHVAILGLTFWAAALAITGTFEQLAAYVVFGAWIFLGLTGLAVVVLRRTQPHRPRPYRTWGHPVTTILFAVAALVISASAFFAAFWNALAGLGLILLGVPAYLYWQRTKQIPI
jgi:APA family basic amino acid/polyamine antiporter